MVKANDDLLLLPQKNKREPVEQEEEDGVEDDSDDEYVYDLDRDEEFKRVKAEEAKNRNSMNYVTDQDETILALTSSDEEDGGVEEDHDEEPDVMSLQDPYQSKGRKKKSGYSEDDLAETNIKKDCVDYEHSADDVKTKRTGGNGFDFDNLLVLPQFHD